MKSSDAVFTKKNPFPYEPLRNKSHYCPSRAKKIPKHQKKLALSPVRFTQSASPPSSPPPHTASLSTGNQCIFEGSQNNLLCRPPSVTRHQIFSESWPLSDQSSSASTGVQELQHAVTSQTQEPSLLAKYIERFRYGRPQSRGERQKLAADMVDTQPFWWMSSNPSQPSSSTLTRTSTECFQESFECRNDGIGRVQDLLEHQADTSLSPTRDLLDLSTLVLSDSSICEQEEPEIVELQEKARKLLQRSEHSQSSCSSGVPISSEGLGCSEFSSHVSVDEPIKKPTIPSLIEMDTFIRPKGLLPAATIPRPVEPRPLPENDILFQWRLRRKMEQARQWSQMCTSSTALHHPLPSMLELHTPGLSFTSVPIETTGTISTPAFHPILEPVPSSSGQVHPSSSVHTKAESITRGHLVLDPCCDQKKTVHLTRPSLKAQACPSEGSGEVNRKQQHSSSPSLQPAKSSERGPEREGGRVQGQQDKKKSVTSSRKKRSDRCVRNGDVIERNQHAFSSQEKYARTRASVRSKIKENAGQREPPGSARGFHQQGSQSPVHNTLGQVVSEVLFPSAESQSSTSPVLTPPAPAHSPAPPPPLPQHSSRTSEVVGQLMQDAQDSDGLEFEDDSLLIVLRQQRKWVKEQLCAVDTMLDKFHED